MRSAATTGTTCELKHHIGPLCSRWAAQHPSEPWNPALLAGAVMHSASLVTFCHSRSGNETRFAAFCRGEEHLAAQLRWLKWLETSTPLSRSAKDVNQSLAANSRTALVMYLQALYPNSQSVSAVSTAAMGFFWHTVPRRTEFRVLWSCAPCSTRGYRAPAALWAPSEEALSSPFRTTRGVLKRCNVTEHPSCKSPAVRSHVLQTVEAAVAVPVHFPGFFRAPAAPGGKGSFKRAAPSNSSLHVPDGQWVEVLRVARWNLQHAQVTDSTRGQVWFWLAVGSGIWWNVGKSLRLSHERNNRAMIDLNGCEGARKQGYDSIQLPNSFGGYVNELVDCTGYGRPGSQDVWELACPPSHIELRVGLPAASTRYAPHIPNETAIKGDACTCCCDSALNHLNCMHQI